MFYRKTDLIQTEFENQDVIIITHNKGNYPDTCRVFDADGTQIDGFQLVNDSVNQCTITLLQAISGSVCIDFSNLRLTEDGDEYEVRIENGALVANLIT
jgi:hypothetical protein